MINQNDIPVILEKLWTSIDKVKDALAEDYKVKRTSQSRLVYGFFMSEPWGDLWVGSYTNTWRDYSAPVIIQIKDKWYSEPYSLEKEKVSSILKDIGFIEHKELGYIYLIKIDSTDLVGEIESKVKGCLTTIKESVGL